MDGLVKTLGTVLLLLAAAIWAAVLLLVPAALVKFCWGYAVQNEVECKTSYINLNIGGALLMGLTDPDEKTIDFIAASRLVPVMDEIKKSDYINYCLRHTASGSRYYVIRDGMIVRAALLPVNLSGNLLETLQKMVNMARETARLCKTEDKEAE